MKPQKHLHQILPTHHQLQCHKSSSLSPDKAHTLSRTSAVNLLITRAIEEITPCINCYNGIQWKRPIKQKWDGYLMRKTT